MTESEDSLDRLVREAQEAAGEPETEGSVDVDAIMNQLTKSTVVKETNQDDPKFAPNNSTDLESIQALTKKEIPPEVRDLLISDMAKKHLGMSEVESPFSRSRIDSIFTTIGSSFEDPDTEECADASSAAM